MLNSTRLLLFSIIFTGDKHLDFVHKNCKLYIKMEESVAAIRDSSRQSLFLKRRRQRDEKTDEGRSIASYSTQKTASEIANKLKTKSSISVEELRTLKNALLDDEKNTEVVLSTHGALRGLVRELSGHDIAKQCAAAGCLCNLALADSKACLTVAKAAGSYLVSLLDNLTEELAITCAWTIGNLCGCCPRVCQVVVAQGAVGSLCRMMGGCGDGRDAAVYALTRLVYMTRDDLSPEHLNKIIENLPQEITPETSQLLFYISCHEHFTAYNEGITSKLIENLQIILHNCENIQELKYIVRTLANMNSKTVYDLLIIKFLSNNLVDKIKLLLCESELCKDFCWLLGNMMNLCGDSDFFKLLLVN